MRIELFSGTVADTNVIGIASLLGEGKVPKTHVETLPNVNTVPVRY
jgi:hypothetical protein